MHNKREITIEKALDNPGNYELLKKEIGGYVFFRAPDIDFTECDITPYLTFNKLFNNHVKKFSILLNKQFPKEYQVNFYKNIPTLSIDFTKRNLFRRFYNTFLKKYTLAGIYDSEKNTITITENYKKSKIIPGIYHELLHMSSRNGKDMIGFSQVQYLQDGNISLFGRMINEGYTEYLNQKYFVPSENKTYTSMYTKEMKIVEYIEKIVGKEKMQSLFFHADLVGLIEELKKYENDDKKILDIFSIAEEINSNIGSMKSIIFERKIRLLLKSIYENKLKNDWNLKIIDDNQFARSKLLNCELYASRGKIYPDDTKIFEFKSKFIIDDGLEKKIIPKISTLLKIKPDALITKPDELNLIFQYHENISKDKKEIQKIKTR